MSIWRVFWNLLIYCIFRTRRSEIEMYLHLRVNTFRIRKYKLNHLNYLMWLESYELSLLSGVSVYDCSVGLHPNACSHSDTFLAECGVKKQYRFVSHRSAPAQPIQYIIQMRHLSNHTALSWAHSYEFNSEPKTTEGALMNSALKTSPRLGVHWLWDVRREIAFVVLSVTSHLHHTCNKPRPTNAIFIFN